ncbi:hypothetical protein PsorP6_019546 [Peronosclerospora sorghi]|nr:hypothetical protein PsorP6_019546 [Peronosclerospora sorghi]
MTDVPDAVQMGVDVRLDERKMYVVEWADGATFGFTVTPVQSDRGTVLCLTRRTTTNNAIAGLQDVMPGDMLIAIGDEKVYHLNPGSATKLLRSVQKPVRLTLQVSPYGAAAKDLPDLAPNEYTCLWESGPLGLVLTTNPKSKLPTVKRFTGKAENLALEQDVNIGDELVYVNQTPTGDHSISSIINMVKELPKPITLRFRRPLAEELQLQVPELKEGEYDFLWEFGSLGLVVGTSAEGLPYVRSFTGKGTSKQLAKVQELDEIVMVNDRSTKELGFHETMQYIINVPKPAVIRFRRSLANRGTTVGTSPKFTESSSAPTAQIAGMRISDHSSQLRRAQSVVLPGHTTSQSLTSASRQSPSPSRCVSVASENEATSALLGYRSARSNSSFTMSRQRHLTRLQNQPQQHVEAMENLTFGQPSLKQKKNGSNGFTSRSPGQPSYQLKTSHEQSPLQEKQYYQPSSAQAQQYLNEQSSFQKSYLQPQATAFADEDAFAINSDAFYQIQWTDGPFGFTVREAQSRQGSLILVTKRTGKDTCAGLRRVAVGDILIKIGDQDVRQLGFERSTMHLRNVLKPVVLTFQAID